MVASKGSSILVNMGTFNLKTVQREMEIRIVLIISNVYKRGAEHEVGKIFFSPSCRNKPNTKESQTFLKFIDYMLCNLQIFVETQQTVIKSN